MRNLLEYPVTQQEIVEKLLAIQKDVLAEDTTSLGSLEAYILGLAAAICSGQHIDDVLGIKRD